MVKENLTCREEIKVSDRDDIRRIVNSTGFFSRDEVALAMELVDERLSKGIKSGYYFLIAEKPRFLVGYTCYGPVPATKASYDLYWIATDSQHRQMGIGTLLMKKTEESIFRLGGRQLYVETSGRPQYAPTRRFYEECGYQRAAFLKDFYAPGDDKIIYAKFL